MCPLQVGCITFPPYNIKLDSYLIGWLLPCIDIFQPCLIKTTGKYLVLRPGNCSVGCTTCGRVCPEEAITFPKDSKKFVKAAVVKYKIFPSVKTALDERLEKFPDHIVHES